MSRKIIIEREVFEIDELSPGSKTKAVICIKEVCEHVPVDFDKDSIFSDEFIVDFAKENKFEFTAEGQLQ